MNNKLKITWMLLVMKFLHHILWIVDELQEPYRQRDKFTEELYDEYEKVKKQLKENLNR